VTLGPGAPVALLGVPSDEHSSFLRGAAAGPASLREALHAPAGNLGTERAFDLADDGRWRDAGDVEGGFGSIEGAVARLLEGGERVLAVGGDHAITAPILRAYAPRVDGLTVLHVDAHPDLYEAFAGDRDSHASPFARVMEEGLAARLVQVGIRAGTAEQRAQAERFGVDVVELGRGWPPRLPELAPPLYVSLDLDVLDPAFAPGVSHPEPGGLTTRELLALLHGLPCPPVGADVVELNPACDHRGATARVAAKLVKELLAAMLGRPQSAA
jgi:agmatinase